MVRIYRTDKQQGPIVPFAMQGTIYLTSYVKPQWKRIKTKCVRVRVRVRVCVCVCVCV